MKTSMKKKLMGKPFSTSSSKSRYPIEQEELVPQNNPQRPQPPSVNTMRTMIDGLAMQNRSTQNLQETQLHGIAQRLTGEFRTRYENYISLYLNQIQTAEQARLNIPDTPARWNSVRILTQDNYIRTVGSLIRESNMAISEEEQQILSNLAAPTNAGQGSLIDDYADTSTEMQDFNDPDA